MENEAEKEQRKSKSPFKDKEEFKTEIKAFINKYKSTVVNQADRMSDFFEMSCFNYLVQYYELNGYDVKVGGLQKGLYRYKCSTMGIQSNFSFFRISKKTADGNNEFEIHHNLAIQSAHHPNIFTTPDITITKANGIDLSKDHYETKITFSYVKQENLVTFCEVKQFNPYPELLFNFIGVVNGLRPLIMSNSDLKHEPVHIAPSLLISGAPNRHAKDIKESLEGRYCINIIYSMFYSASKIFSKTGIRQLNCTGNFADRKTKKATVTSTFKSYVKELTEDEDLPF